MAAAFLFSTYLQVDLYVRANFMEFASLAVLPFALWMLVRAADRDPGRFRVPLAALGIALIPLSQNTVAPVCIAALVFTAILVAGTNLRRLLAVALSVIGGLALSAFFWVPALLEKSYVHADRLKEGILNYGEHFVYPLQLLYSPWGYGLSKPGIEDGMSFMIGPLLIILGLTGFAVLFVHRKRRLHTTEGRLALGALLCALVFAFLSTNLSKTLWSLFPALQAIEFPWRVLAIPALMLSLLAGLAFLQRAKSILVAAAVAAIFLAGIFHAKPKQFLTFDDEFYEPGSIAKKGMSTTTREEYEPVAVKKRSPYNPQRLESLTCPAAFQATKSPEGSPSLQVYQVSAPEPCRVRLNTFYFPGWEVFIDGKKAAVAIEEGTALMLFDVPSGSHRIEARLGSTPLRASSRWVSLAAALALAAAALVSRLKKPSPPAADPAKESIGRST
jgi:hypothetical protein